MSYEVKTWLTEDGCSVRGVLQIFHQGELIGEYADKGEPEDNSFFRDYDWVAGELKRAYLLGKTDQLKEVVADEKRQLGEDYGRSID